MFGEPDSGPLRSEKALISWLIGVPITGNLLNVGIVVLALWPLSPWTEIRAMGLAVLMLLIPAGTTLLGTSISVIALFAAPKKVKLLGCEAFCLFASLSTYFLGKAMFDFIVFHHHLVLKK